MKITIKDRYIDFQDENQQPLIRCGEFNILGMTRFDSLATSAIKVMLVVVVIMVMVMVMVTTIQMVTSFPRLTVISSQWPTTCLVT